MNEIKFFLGVFMGMGAVSAFAQEGTCAATNDTAVRYVYACNISSFSSLQTGALSESIENRYAQNFGGAEISFYYPSGASAFNSSSNISMNMVKSSHRVSVGHDYDDWQYSVATSEQRNIGAHIFNITTRSAFENMDLYERERFNSADDNAIVDVNSTTPLRISMNYRSSFGFDFLGEDSTSFGSAGGTVYASSRSDLGDFSAFTEVYSAIGSHHPADSVARPFIYTSLPLDQPYYTIITEYETSLFYYGDNGDSVVSMDMYFFPPTITCPTCEYDSLMITWSSSAPVPEPSTWALIAAGGLLIGLAVCRVRPQIR